MKKAALLSFIMSLMAIGLGAQNVEVEGKTKITVMDTVTDVSANVVRQSDGTLAVRQYKICDMAQGGIVFYVDESGEHGLAADTANLSTSIRWYGGTFGNTQAKGDGPFAGEMNTAIIISSQVAIGDDGNTYASRLCAELQKGGYGDWYLPSKEELNLMYTNLHLASLGGFAGESYWSSTEGTSGGTAWAHNFEHGGQNTLDADDNYHVRAVRAF
ncbi:MAG: DUF1566 domain-containing protein [Saprospiraceae bacterium]|nr:DUF1566 domain-containing protein [Saprospiraceae bacterium]